MSKIIETEIFKSFRSREYNYDFNKVTGYFKRWGKTLDEDPQTADSPEILDIEVSAGKCSGNCPWCYKSNSSKDEVKYMSLETFKKIFVKLPKHVGQIALGITDLDANPDLWKIMEFCRTNDYNKVVPNITINGNNLTDGQAGALARLCGAVAVSYYSDNVCFDAVKKLTDLGMTQINLHVLLALETYDNCLALLDKVKTDSRLAKLNAVVFLTLKPKGNRNKFHQLNDLEKYRVLINKALSLGVSFGCDSCQAERLMLAVQGTENYKKFEPVVESCESTNFSFYIDTEARGYPCSFAPGIPGWETGIDMLEAKDFLADVWNHPRTIAFRNTLLASQEKSCVNCRTCPFYKL